MDSLNKTRSGHGGDIYSDPSRTYLDLSANINPHPLPPRVYEELPRLLEQARAYPDIEYRALRRDLAAYASRLARVSIPPDWIIPGNGAVELLDKAIAAFRHGLVVRPAFSEYELSFLRHGIPCQTLDRTLSETGILGRELTRAILDRLESDRSLDGLVLCNPNNPDGARWDPSAFRELAGSCRELGVAILLDETFGEYLAEDTMLLPLTLEYDNLMVVKALTKFFGLPGVRLGYLIAADDARRRRIQHQLTTWNVGAFAQGIAHILLEDEDFSRRSREENGAARQELADLLQSGGYFRRIYPSGANFLLAVDPAMPRLTQALRQEGILIRDLSNMPGLGPGYARIAVKAGTAGQLIAALDKLGARHSEQQEE